MRTLFIMLSTGFIWLIACHKKEDLPLALATPAEEYAGGTNGTTFDFSENAFGEAVKGLNGDQEGYFVTGNSFFRTNWVSAPGSVNSVDGLGPIMNALSCGSCHFKDGRAKPPATSEEVLNGLLFRLSIPGVDAHGGPLGDPNYGEQLQDKAIQMVQAEAKVRVSYTLLEGNMLDGTYSLRNPVYVFEDLQYGPLAAGWMFSPRIAPQLPGLGLLELVPETDILAWVDEQDANSDGISGRANYVWDAVAQQSKLGRFGWKANQPNLYQQTAGAFNGDLGITTPLFPQDHLTAVQQAAYSNVPNGGNPELEEVTLKKVVSYMQCLSVPARRNYNDPVVLRGKYLFSELKCAACHRPEMQTGNNGAIEALFAQHIFPYTDLLLHDMGPELADNRPDYLASGSEWRTPPLWGLGLIKTVNDHTFLLHDGRARNAEEAILWHGGEGAGARDRYKRLNAEDRLALLQFLDSL